uniref:Ig-like domain-containing protein n=1 Tax=Sus scrofa TaxID=9823 RepID=A0A8D1VZJ8_PIG
MPASLSPLTPTAILSPLFPTGSSLAQTVTQPQWEVPGQEAETVTLDCTYTTSESDYYLFWYKQLPNGEMIFIIRQEAYKQQNATNNRYSVNFQKAAKSFGLRISASQLEDAGVYFCAYSAPQ